MGGFWRNFISLRPEIQTMIDTMGNSIAAIDGSATTFLCAGMSMGAPLASLAGLHLSNLGHTSNGVVTFGSPRVGNLKLAEAIVTTILRVWAPWESHTCVILFPTCRLAHSVTRPGKAFSFTLLSTHRRRSTQRWVQAL